MNLPVALTIAGSDSSGGAGIEADLRSFALLGVHGACVITAITAQNTRGVMAIEPVPIPMVEAQLHAVFQDLKVQSVKTGMLGSPELIERITHLLKRYHPPALLIDPVLIAQSGDELVGRESIPALRKLCRLATLVTPNLEEGGMLLGRSIAPEPRSLLLAAQELSQLLHCPVLLKGGHAGGARSDDLLVLSREEHYWFRAPRLPLPRTHGTGCHLSAAICAFLARGYPLREAVSRGKRWLTRALLHARPVGKGAVPPYPGRLFPSPRPLA